MGCLNKKKALEGPGGGENASKQKEDAFRERELVEGLWFHYRRSRA
jgi:hypothetical protein